MKTALTMFTLFGLSTANTAEELELPPLLVTENGNVVDSEHAWQSQRRGELLELFKTNVYGRTPVGRPDDFCYTVTSCDPCAMSGKATRKLVELRYSGPGGGGRIQLTVFIPNEAAQPAPGFLLICNRKREHIDPTREKKSSFWPAEELVDRGFVAAAFHNSDADPDEHDGFQNGVHGIFDAKDRPRPPDAWGALAAWAWGASRCMDYFQIDRQIDHTRVGVVGHSRGGKTALWCGAQDQRFALVVSNNSGSSGAALARHKHGESIKDILRFRHWFCANYDQFADKEDELPVDQHMLIALMTPRLVYVASATLDDWADPRGEFLACVHAEPAFELHGVEGLGATEMPPADSPIHRGHIGYHLRTGKHDLGLFDWKCYMDFADMHWKK